MSFEQNKYTIIKSAISKELAAFVYDYFSRMSHRHTGWGSPQSGARLVSRFRIPKG